MRLLKTITPLALLLLLTACGSGGNPTVTKEGANEFAGVISGDNLSGTVLLTVAETANTSKLAPQALISAWTPGAYNVTGTYTAGGDTAPVTGTATVAANGTITVKVTGTLASSGNTVTLDGTYDPSDDTFSGTVTVAGAQVGTFAAISGNGGAPLLYCGTFGGHDTVGGGCNVGGVWNFTVGPDAGAKLRGAYAGAITGCTDPNNDGTTADFVSGSRPLSNTLMIQYTAGSAQGTIDMSSAEGTWSADTLGTGQWNGGRC